MARPFTVVTAVFALSPTICGACSCSDPLSIEAAIGESTYVFLAETKSANVVSDWWSGEKWMEIGIDRVVVWKGAELPFDVAKTPASEAACGMAVMVPGQYWFFVDENGFFTQCGRTMLASSAAASSLNVQASDKVFETRRNQR